MRNSKQIANLLKSKLSKRKKDNKLITQYRQQLDIALGKAIMKAHPIHNMKHYTVATFNKNFKIVPKN